MRKRDSSANRRVGIVATPSERVRKTSVTKRNSAAVLNQNLRLLPLAARRPLEDRPTARRPLEWARPRQHRRDRSDLLAPLLLSNR
eukprot:2078616-Heterocapsa_arctica.AAC.1